jgi:hypothetical protein
MATKIARMPVRAKASEQLQRELELHVECEVDRDGVGMGVLSDGTPFLNQRGIGDLCGLRNKYVGIISAEWNSPTPPVEVERIKALLREQNHEVPDSPHIEVWVGRRLYFAYPDTVCMAILEYFAFEAGRAGADVALRNYRKLARFGLRQFIYQETGYVSKGEDDLWKIFRDRVSLTYDAVPSSYFSVFKELASVLVTLGLAGLHIDEKFVPDISVGQAWAKHWERENLARVHGARATYAHNYPAYFPQAASNPQLASCYPETALGEFRRWFREEYIGEGGFKRYLARKVNERLLPAGYVEKAMLALMKD